MSVTEPTPPPGGKIRIATLQPEWVDAAKLVIYTVVNEYCCNGLEQPELKELVRRYEDEKRIDDVDKWHESYEESGTFLVLLDAEQVVGTGGVMRIDDQTAELKRMWFLPPYRGRGLGKQMAEMLVACATGKGYKHLVLTADARQTAAIRLFERIGFKVVGEQGDFGLIKMEKHL